MTQVLQIPAHVIHVLQTPAHALQVLQILAHVIQVLQTPAHTIHVLQTPAHMTHVLQTPAHVWYMFHKNLHTMHSIADYGRQTPNYINKTYMYSVYNLRAKMCAQQEIIYIYKYYTQCIYVCRNKMNTFLKDYICDLAVF